MSKILEIAEDRFRFVVDGVESPVVDFGDETDLEAGGRVFIAECDLPEDAEEATEVEWCAWDVTDPKNPQPIEDITVVENEDLPPVAEDTDEDEEEDDDLEDETDDEEEPEDEDEDDEE